MDRPALAVAALLGRQQIALGPIQINPDQYRLPALENLVVAGGVYRAEGFYRITLARLRHRPHDNIMDAAERERAVQHSTEELNDPAKGAMAQQHPG
jgi:hypothetical protein